MAREFIPDRVLSILAVPVLTWMGLSGSTQIACAQGRAYVANFGSNTVSVIDTSSNTVVATVNVGSQPYAVAVTPDGTQAYVANCGGDVFVIATSNNTVSAKVVVGGCPYDVAITPDGTRAYVVRDNANSVWAIDTSSNTVVAKVTVADTPGAIAITPDGTRAYVVSVGTLSVSPAVSVIDISSNTVVTTLSVAELGRTPVGVAITPDGKHAYVPNTGGYVSVIDTSSNTVTTQVTVPGIGISQVGVAITPDGKHAYVTTFGPNGSNPVAVIDTSSNTVVANIPVGVGATGVAISPDGTRAYVTVATNTTGIGNGIVSVIDTSNNSVVTTIPVGSTPFGVTSKAGGGSAYTCTNTAKPVIASIDSASAYGGYSYFASGSWLEIKGTNLADPNDPRLGNSSHSGQWTAADFSAGNAPTILDGISVTINGKAAYVWYLSPTQLNIQAPQDSTTDNVAITVTNCKATSSPTMFTRRNLAPGLLAPPNYSSGGTPYMVATFASDGAYVLNTSIGASLGLNSRPAKPGDVIIAYGVGFGDVTPSILPGVIVQQSNALVNPVTFSFGSTNATTSYSGLAGSFVGLYEFYITVPPGLANGDYHINVTQNGVAVPQTMYLTVHN
jgi:uncharacterized protein (TIGR03437 family)